MQLFLGIAVFSRDWEGCSKTDRTLLLTLRGLGRISFSDALNVTACYQSQSGGQGVPGLLCRLPFSAFGFGGGGGGGAEVGAEFFEDAGDVG